MKYVLTSRTSVSDSVILITLKPSHPRAMLFQPGQYAALRFKRYGRYTPARCFSIVSRPNPEGILQFAVRVKGKFTSALKNLKLDSVIEVEGPFGDFRYDPGYDQRSVMLAGGIGITPIFSIIDSHLKADLPNRFTVLYSVKDDRDAPFADELMKLETADPNLRVILAVSDNDSGRFDRQHTHQGKISPLLVTSAANNDFVNTSFFICGPAGFTRHITRILDEHKIPPLRINIESFTASRVGHRGVGMSPAWRKLASVYGLAAIAFMVILGTISVSDGLNQPAVVTENINSTPVTNPVAPVAAEPVVAAPSTPVQPATPPSAPSQPASTPVYQPPVSAES